MQVNVTKFYESNSEETLIEFSSQYGTAKGFWKGSKPKVNQRYYVEIDIPKLLIWGTDIIESNYREYKMWSEQNNIFLNVKMECCEDDDCLTVRLGDSIILIEVEGIPCSKGSFLKIQLDKILIYPYDL